MILQDLRFAFRQMSKSRGYALAVVLTLTLGVGIDTAVFSMVDGFLMRSLPYPQPDRVAALILHTQGVSPKSGAFVAEEDDSHTGETWQLVKDGAKAVTLGSWGGSNGVNLQTGVADGGAVRYVRESRVSADYFNVLGIPLYLGRAFSTDEDHPNGAKVTILGYGLWQSTFRADPQVVGKTVQLKGESYTVVGVLPRNAVTPSNADLFTPLQPATTGECGGNNCGIIMRLKPGATWGQVEVQLRNIRSPEFAERENTEKILVSVLCSATLALSERRYAAKARGADARGKLRPVDCLRQPRRPGVGAICATHPRSRHPDGPRRHPVRYTSPILG